MMNNFCSKCGSKIDAGQKFCSKCGNSVGNNSSISENNLPNQNKKDGFRTASLVIGIISIVLCWLFSFLIIPLAVIGLIFGIVSWAKSKKFCAGIVLNLLGIIIPIVVALFIFSWIGNIIDESVNDLSNENYNDEYEYDEDNIYDYSEDSSDMGVKFEGNLIYSSGDNDDTLTGDFEVVIPNDKTETNDIDYFQELKLNEVVTKINNKDDFILVVSQTYCSHCINFKPKMEMIASENKLSMYYLEFDVLSVDEKSTLLSYITLNGTPTTYFFNDGVSVPDTHVSGDMDKNEMENILRNKGYIS